MNDKYTAIVYTGKELLAKQVGNNIDELYAWMLIQGSGNFADIHGEVIDNKSKKIVKTFRKSSIE
ncbi:hypothetical protein [Legionella sp.]|uniref:hypothetical protein n=1 Tax=Legionella sp. TaxID=459 RepID=UPI003CB90766